MATVKTKTINVYPQFVRIKSSICALRLTGDTYYRDAGNWRVSFKETDGKLFVYKPNGEHLHGKELIRTTKKFWCNDNGGYVPVGMECGKCESCKYESNN